MCFPLYIKSYYRSTMQFIFLHSRHIYQRRQWHPTLVLLPGKSHGRGSLVVCSPWGCEESDMTEQLHFHFSLLCIGEGNGSPLQCSCLENPGMGSHRVGHDWSDLAAADTFIPLLIYCWEKVDGWLTRRWVELSDLYKTGDLDLGLITAMLY